MIQIPKSIVDRIVEQARNELPNEACGLLAGEGNRIVKGYPLINADASPEHFSFFPAEQFQTLRTVRADGLQILANYHSHPVTPARPSQEDIRLAYDSDILYVIVSLAEVVPVVKAFKIQQGRVEQVVVEIITNE
jgi:[CysO sulfur-carrier protein]-S-L-cysteine hydrolase